MPFPIHSGFNVKVWLQDSATHNEPHFHGAVDGGVEGAGDDSQDDKHNVADNCFHCEFCFVLVYDVEIFCLMDVKVCEGQHYRMHCPHIESIIMRLSF